MTDETDKRDQTDQHGETSADDEAGKRRDAGQYDPARYDEIYKKLFAFPEVIRDLLRDFFCQPWLDQIDLSTLEKLSAEFISEDLLKRHGDAVWGVRRRAADQWLYAVVVIEFQRRRDPWMALRISTYTDLLCEELVRNAKAPPGGPLPFVLPVVVYNGRARWRAVREKRELFRKAAPDPTPNQPAQGYAVVDERNLLKDTLPSDSRQSLIAHIEQTASVADYEYARERINRPEVADGLWRALMELQRQALKREAPAGVKLPPLGSRREEEKMSLAEGMSEWSKPWIQQGLAQGIEQGLEQGIEQGLAQGLAQQRALLARLAQQRFGEETAGRVADALEQTADAERLAEAGEAIVQCASGDELVERVTRIAAAPETA